MDVLDDDLLHFWKSLTRRQVRYIMVGGFATRFHGFNRATDDVDMWLEDTSANRKNLELVFEDMGYEPHPDLETMEFIPGWTTFYMAGSIELDIMTSMKGLEDTTFDECLQLASIAEIEGVQIPFLHINHLIRNKEIINRPKDKVDVIELEKIRRVREEEKDK